ncbi:hypothetical protein ASG02_10790 [Exiguobacterium sp. Leaf196]|nr:hypothetical protein ASG02_10790 [Exiguobacterium sp. Leaf196]
MDQLNGCAMIYPLIPISNTSMIKVSGNRKKRRYTFDMNVLSFSFITAFSRTFIDSSRFFLQDI